MLRFAHGWIKFMYEMLMIVSIHFSGTTLWILSQDSVRVVVPEYFSEKKIKCDVPALGMQGMSCSSMLLLKGWTTLTTAINIKVISNLPTTY
jgi:hypothetical protein